MKTIITVFLFVFSYYATSYDEIDSLTIRCGFIFKKINSNLFFPMNKQYMIKNINYTSRNSRNALINACNSCLEYIQEPKNHEFLVGNNFYENFIKIGPKIKYEDLGRIQIILVANNKSCRPLDKEKVLIP